ncbi:hypothetical protein BGZ54_010343 [Gamsiella multidivaricata]|nr:hypothetical protein BGZ54_010343 [Gamsiella multidivaricata]
MPQSTPKDLWPCDSIKDLKVNLRNLELPSDYFTTHTPAEWLPESFLKEGYRDLTSFLSGLRSLSSRKEGVPRALKLFCRDLVNYLSTDDGRSLLDWLALSYSISIEQDVFRAAAELKEYRAVNTSPLKHKSSSSSPATASASVPVVTAAGATFPTQAVRGTSPSSLSVRTKAHLHEQEQERPQTESGRAVDQDTAPASTLESSLALPRSDYGRQSSVSRDEDVVEHTFHVDPASFSKYKYYIDGTNVGQLFLDYQRTSTVVVNNVNMKANVENLGRFLAMNYIWVLDVCPKNMSAEIHKSIVQQHTWPRSALPYKVTCLCMKLDEQLADGLEIDAKEAEGRDLRSIILFYEVLEMKLPVEYLSFENGIEDTYCHSVVDALFTRQFPARSVYYLDWANKESQGSRERRGYGYKPDATISKCNRELAFVEVKPPKEQRCTRSYLEDLWKLANLCKDAIDLHLRTGHDIRKAAAVQIFGHRMVLYTMVYDHGVYHWAKSCVAFLPCDQTDSGRVMSCLRLLLSLEAFLDTIDADLCPKTPPRIELDHDVDEQADLILGRPTKITPSKRNMF